MEEYQYDNPKNVDFYAAKFQPATLKEAPDNEPSNEATGDPKPPYTPLGLWIKEVKYSYGSQR